MGFLGSLSDQLSSQFSLGENSTHSLDSVIDGSNVKYGSLGDFASKIDQSAERKYLEEGYLRRDPFNTDSKQFEILMQQPSATVLVKKRMFSSVGENFRPDFMDKDEKLYYKTMKTLFQNKCNQISALEKLSKIEKIVSATGTVNDQLMSIIFSLSDSVGSAQNNDNFFSSGGNSNSEIKTFSDTIDKIKRLYAFNQTSNSTNWITDNTNLFQSQLGQGTGVIEITNFTNISTTLNVELNSPGGFNMTIVDPYEAMVITEFDIEKAISDATNLFNQHKITEFGKQTSDQIINDLTIRLNQYRNSRNVSPITFKINPNTLLGKRVTAVFDRIGIELPFQFDSSSISALSSGLFGGSSNGVTVAPEYLINGNVAGIDGLDDKNKSFNNFTFAQAKTTHLSADSELSLFQQLVKAIFNKITLDANSKNSLQQSNKNTNYTRRKLRANFLGRVILQPMDSVHIYMGSKSKYDNKLLSGLKSMFTGLNYLQAVGGVLADTKRQIDSLFNPSAISVQVEKSAFVGSDFPNFLWNLLRPQFVSEKEGTHVFGGLVDFANGDYNEGKFVVNVRGSDNSSYFTMGKVNFKPAADVWNGSLYDPLTPFKTKFDTVSTNFKDETPELLDENKVILGGAQDSSTPLLKFKMGPNAGRAANEGNYIQDRTIDPVTKQFTRTFYAPDGLVYKWKEGIGSFVQFGSSFDLNDPTKVGTPTIAKDPFAGQDVMNVISLLVTGTPYNFATYWKASQNIDGFSKDPHSQQDSAYSFYTSLKNDLQKNNRLWGNFVPFKNLVIDEASYAQSLNTLASIRNKNKQVEDKLNQLNELNNQAIFFGSSIAAKFIAAPGKTSSDVVEQINIESKKINKDVNDILIQLQQEDKTYFIQTGDEITFDFDQFLYSGNDRSKLADAASRRFLRRQINFLTRRMSYNVRANEDKNLFIVDDFYDKDYDIAAFNSALDNGISLYNNEFLSVKDKIKAAADLLNLEVFCDTQGHVRVRPPQYNRMPSSIFYKMMYQKKALGIQVFPQFLDDLFSTQLKTLKERLEIVEDEIRLDCTILGANNDADALTLILGSDALKASGSPFAFISNSEGAISDIGDLLKQANPEESSTDASFTTIKGQATSTKDIFTSAQRFAFIDKVISNNTVHTIGPNPFNLSDITNFDTNLKINTLVSRIEIKSGQKINKANYYVVQNNPAPVLGIAPVNFIDVFKVTKELGDKIAERQKVLKLFYNCIKNVTELKSLDDDSNVSNQLLIPGVYGNQNIPEVFEHMIEDESYDDYGPGSGQRYIIKNSQIKSYSIAENPPEFTLVEVQGVLNEFAPGGLPDGLNSFPGGGNALVTAAAVDYDLWRNYGFRNQSVIRVPFLSDPQSQCAPYAASILSRAHKNILRGSITISGNEYMQPGEVIYLENRGLLFYVTSVKHNYSEGNNFTTTLDLSYGHTPGEYIPTTLDIIGKVLYNNKDIAGYQVQRQSSAFNESNLGTIILDPEAKSTDLAFGDVGGPNYGPDNATIINNILYNASFIINANNSKGNNIKATMELRVYYDSTSNNPEPDSNLISFAKYISSIMTGAATLNDTKAKNSSNKKVITLPSGSVIINQIDVSSTTEPSSPSQKACDAARNIMNSHGMSASTTDDSNSKERDKLRKSLFSYIVDCWVKFELLPPSPTGT